MQGRDAVCYCFLLVIALLFNAIMSNMSPFRDCLFCCDVDIFYTMGKSWTLGYVPYVDFIDTKGPLLILIFAIGYLMSPDSTTGVYLLASLATFVTLLYLYKTAVYYLQQPIKAMLVVLCCAAALYFKPYYGYGPRSEQFLLPFIALLIWFSSTRIDKLRSDFRCRLLYGACLGCSTAVFFLVKYLYMLFPMFCMACLIACHLRDEYRLRIIGSLLLSYIVSSVMVVLPFAVYIIYTDSLEEFIWVYFTLSSEYVSNGVSVSIIQKITLLLLGLFDKCVKQPMFWVALFSTLCMFTPYYQKRMSLRTRVVCVSSFGVLILVCSMGFWAYYLLMYFPLLVFPVTMLVDKLTHNKYLLCFLCVAAFLFTVGNYLVILNIRQSQAFDFADPLWSQDYQAVEQIIKRKERARILYLDQLDQGLGIRTGAVPAAPIWFSWYSENEKIKGIREEAVRNRLPDFIVSSCAPSQENLKLLQESGYKAEITFVNYAARKSAITLWSKDETIKLR